MRRRDGSPSCSRRTSAAGSPSPCWRMSSAPSRPSPASTSWRGALRAPAPPPGPPPPRGTATGPAGARGPGAPALRPPDVVPFRYGRHSSVLHKREAVARGLPARVLHAASLARDVDEPKDLPALLGRPAETATHRLLAELGIAERLAGAVPSGPA